MYMLALDKFKWTAHVAAAAAAVIALVGLYWEQQEQVLLQSLSNRHYRGLPSTLGKLQQQQQQQLQLLRNELFTAAAGQPQQLLAVDMAVERALPASIILKCVTHMNIIPAAGVEHAVLLCMCCSS
jgi:hypothetical protein